MPFCFYLHNFILNWVLSPGLHIKEVAHTRNQESEALDVSGQIPPNVNLYNIQIYACLHGSGNRKAVTQTATQAPNNSDDKHCFFKAERRFWGGKINQNMASLKGEQCRSEVPAAPQTPISPQENRLRCYSVPEFCNSFYSS